MSTSAQPAPVLLKQIVDGFSYSTRLRYLPLYWFPNALAQMDILRRATQYRSRDWVIPQDQNQPIAGYDTLYYQLSVAAGSYLWGYSFASLSAVDPSNNPIATTAADLMIQVVDACSGIPLFQDFVVASAAHSTGNAGVNPPLLSQPRLIIDPGLINVFITNRTANTVTCQLLLKFAEHCKIVTEAQRQVAAPILTGPTTGGQTG